jgi:TetR/AcrR family transcriptional regulator, mexJK operon transcriptional repressor
MTSPPHPGLPAKHQAITDAARRVFLEHGYTHTSVDAIAAEAGVSKQTIYNHFGDKATLFRAVMLATVAESGSGFGPFPHEELAESDDLDRDLRRFARTLARGVLQPDIAALRRVLMAELDRHPELFNTWGGQAQQLHGMLADAIARQTERGVLDVPDPALAAQQLVQLTAGTALMISRFGVQPPPDAELDKAVDDGIDLWLRAYRAAPSTAARKRRATSSKA